MQIKNKLKQTKINRNPERKNCERPELGSEHPPRKVNRFIMCEYAQSPIILSICLYELRIFRLFFFPFILFFVKTQCPFSIPPINCCNGCGEDDKTICTTLACALLRPCIIYLANKNIHYRKKAINIYILLPLDTLEQDQKKTQTQYNNQGNRNNNNNQRETVKSTLAQIQKIDTKPMTPTTIT